MISSCLLLGAIKLRRLVNRETDGLGFVSDIYILRRVGSRLVVPVGVVVKPTDIARLSPVHREFVRDQLDKRSKRPATAISAATPTRVYDSDAEARYAQLLDALTRSEAEHWDGTRVLEWSHHTIRFQVGAHEWYTPDFGLVVVHNWGDPDRIVERWRLVEVKGSWKAKNARESRAKLCAAALLNPWFEWEAALVNGQSFDHEVIGAR